ncbi:MAG TPA: 5'/3'-nucleotidase SurE [Gammaproteobacteria bacterium]|nr:5'/3'-nucleotidase SurE [Gammaproteobacteria bacterium]
MDRTTSKRLAIFGTLIIIVSFCYNASSQDYRILVTNDDGIESPLLHNLVANLALMNGVEIVVAAPNENQSGSSQSSIGGPLVVEELSMEGATEAYSISGRPADAVRFAVVQLQHNDKFDLVISGVNRGANVGNVSHLSGTVGAAMEGVYHGLPAIAVSQEVTGVETGASAKFILQLVERYRTFGAPQGVVMAINIPSGDLKGVAVRAMGDSYLMTDSYSLNGDSEGKAYFEPERRRTQSTRDFTDTYAYQHGYITVTPLDFDWTAYSLIEDIESWGLGLP